MNKEEFTLICSIQEILDRIKENGTTLSVVPFEEDMNVKWFDVYCKTRSCDTVCSKRFFISDLLSKESYEEYFSESIFELMWDTKKRTKTLDTDIERV